VPDGKNPGEVVTGNQCPTAPALHDTNTTSPINKASRTITYVHPGTAPVAQSGTLLYRRLSICRAIARSMRFKPEKTFFEFEIFIASFAVA
jgi:hypothetical protein